MSIQEVEEELETTPTNAAKKMLLIKYCLTGNVEKADTLKAQLDSEGFTYSADILRTLGSLAASKKKNLEEAIGYKNQLEDKYPNFKAYFGLVMRIAILQVKQGHFQGEFK